MTAEQLDPLRNWWQELSFAGKEHYRLDDEGNITLAISGMAEVPVGNVAEENRDALLKQLQDQFDAATKSLQNPHQELR